MKSPLKKHILDLTLSIEPSFVIIDKDKMDDVFDYDPLIKGINALARESHYETQERLITLIVKECSTYDVIKGLDLFLRKSPGFRSIGKLSVRIILDEQDLNKLRHLETSLQSYLHKLSNVSAYGANWRHYIREVFWFIAMTRRGMKMKLKSQTRQTDAAKAIKDIRQSTRKQYSAEEKIRIVLDGLRDEEIIAELCRHGGKQVSRVIRTGPAT